MMIGSSKSATCLSSIQKEQIHHFYGLDHPRHKQSIEDDFYSSFHRDPNRLAQQEVVYGISQSKTGYHRRRVKCDV